MKPRAWRRYVPTSCVRLLPEGRKKCRKVSNFTVFTLFLFLVSSTRRFYGGRMNRFRFFFSCLIFIPCNTTETRKGYRYHQALYEVQVARQLWEFCCPLTAPRTLIAGEFSCGKYRTQCTIVLAEWILWDHQSIVAARNSAVSWSWTFIMGRETGLILACCVSYRREIKKTRNEMEKEIKWSIRGHPCEPHLRGFVKLPVFCPVCRKGEFISPECFVVYLGWTFVFGDATVQPQRKYLMSTKIPQKGDRASGGFLGVMATLTGDITC